MAPEVVARGGTTNFQGQPRSNFIDAGVSLPTLHQARLGLKCLRLTVYAQD